MQYLVPLDGLRALAIIAVLIFHASPAALPGGFTGVDVFFVLSGFLITSILLDDIKNSTFSMKEFYLRRILRLLPNLFATVLVTVLLWKFLAPPSLTPQPALHGLWAIGSASNLYIWKFLGGYWEQAADRAPLTHTWSLGVEEQFYLVFPGLLLLLFRFQPRRILHWFMGAGLLSFAICAAGTYWRPAASFYLLPTRVWELLLGAGLAAWRMTSDTSAGLSSSQGNRSTVRMAVAFGLVLVLGGFCFINEHASFPGFISLIPTIGTFLLLYSVTRGDPMMSRILSTRPLVLIGKMSYSLYLWHWPLVTMGKFQAAVLGYPRIAGASLGLLAGIVLGSLAYFAIEQPMRRRGPARTLRLWLLGGGFVLTVGLCATEAGRRTVPDPKGVFEPPTFAGKSYDTGRSATQRLELFPRYADVRLPTVPESQRSCWRTGGIKHLNGGERPQVVVLGSSHAMALSALIDDICRVRGIPVAFLAADNGTPAFFEAQQNMSFATDAEAQEFDDARRRWLREWRPKLVIAVDRWDARPGGVSSFESGLRSFLKELEATTETVALVAQVPVISCWEDLNLREFVLWRMGRGTEVPRLRPDPKDNLRREIAAMAESVAHQNPRLKVLRADLQFYLPDGSIRYLDQRKFLYADDNHLSDAGADSIRGLFEELLGQVRKGP
jgi:peptidoglycan/LPS O-acetylase OafA/YrhL